MTWETLCWAKVKCLWYHPPLISTSSAVHNHICSVRFLQFSFPVHYTHWAQFVCSSELTRDDVTDECALTRPLARNSRLHCKVRRSQLCGPDRVKDKNASLFFCTSTVPTVLIISFHKWLTLLQAENVVNKTYRNEKKLFKSPTHCTIYFSPTENSKFDQLSARRNRLVHQNTDEPFVRRLIEI